MRIAKESSFCATPTNIQLNLAFNTPIGSGRCRSPCGIIIFHIPPRRGTLCRDAPRQGCRRGRYARYVGSANLLSSSEGLSLETGLLVEGGAAAQVAPLVDAVLRVAWAF